MKEGLFYFSTSMNESASDFELPSSFGARSASTRISELIQKLCIGISSKSNLNQMHTMKAKKTEHIKKMESHNSISFQLRVIILVRIDSLSRSWEPNLCSTMRNLEEIHLILLQEIIF